MMEAETCQPRGFDAGELGSSHWLVHHPAHWLVLAGRGVIKSWLLARLGSVETQIVWVL